MRIVNLMIKEPPSADGGREAEMSDSGGDPPPLPLVPFAPLADFGEAASLSSSALSKVVVRNEVYPERRECSHVTEPCALPKRKY